MTATKKAPARKSAIVEALDNAAPDRVPVGPVAMSDPASAADPIGPLGVPTDHLTRIPLAEIHESPLNPRKHFDAAALEQLMDSLLSTGQLTPVVVRPRAAGGYELGAGHRRRRAAALAVEQHPDGARYRGLGELLAIVRDLDDRAFIELLNVENLQRDDLHPLEEAEGFRTLMERAGYDVAKIAKRIGKSTRYVYDSLTLLKLIPAAKTLFLAGRFERGHAIELARLGKEDQERALASEDASGYRLAGLFEPEHVQADQADLDLDDEGEPRKPVSVREFKAWVDEHVRLKPADADPVLFPDTAAAAAVATPRGKTRLIEITYLHVTPPDARDPDAPRIYGSQAWRSATTGIPDPGYGADDGTPCAHSITGAVVVGPRRGESFQVCIAKEQCPTHWGEWQKERAKRQRERRSVPAASRQPAKEEAPPPRRPPPWEDDDAVHEYVKSTLIPARITPALVKQVLGCGLPGLTDEGAVALGSSVWQTMMNGGGLDRAKGAKVAQADWRDLNFDNAWGQRLGKLLPGKPSDWGLRTVEQCRSAIALALWLVKQAPSADVLRKEAIAAMKAAHEAKAPKQAKGGKKTPVKKSPVKKSPKPKAKKKGGR